MRSACALALALAASATPMQRAAAQAAMAPQVTPPPAGPVLAPAPATGISGPTGSAVVNLIRLLVEQGILTQDKANALIRQAEDEAANAARAVGSASAAPAATVAVAPNAPDAAPAASGGVPPPVASASVRVPYIPEIVRRQIRDEVKEEVLQEARNENWAAPNAIPEWTKRFQLYGDFRLRYEWDIFDKRNSSFFPNFQALNAGQPFDLNNAAGTPPPLLNTTEDRQRARLRFRLGVTTTLLDDLTVGLRLATGDLVTVTTENQTLGSTFNRYNFLLDNAFLNYRPNSSFSIWLGRFNNPWFSTDLVWWQDLDFDGVAAQYNQQVAKGLTVFSTAGAFPLQNTIFNFPDNSSDKQPSRDKWLFGAQTGFDWQISKNYDVKLGAAYYYFDQIEGKLSSACTVFSAADPCDTDFSRPGYLQQGNTLFAIRDLVSVAPNPPVFQYYGLASAFRELNVTGRVDIANFAPIHVVLDGDYVTNLAFNASKVAAKNPVNNLGASSGSGPGSFVGGNNAFQARLTFGYPDVAERWQWNLMAAYKRVESDSVVDAFNDPDFHLGGTNAKGYIVGGTLGLSHNVNLLTRWLSASEVSGAPYSVDVVQVDLNAHF
jgi:hypothetical protein